MKLTKKQKLKLLPALQRIVQSHINSWDAARDIEDLLGSSFTNMSEAAETFAVSYSDGSRVTTEDVQDYCDALEVD